MLKFKMTFPVSKQQETTGCMFSVYSHKDAKAPLTSALIWVMRGRTVTHRSNFLVTRGGNLDGWNSPVPEWMVVALHVLLWMWLGYIRADNLFIMYSCQTEHNFGIAKRGYPRFGNLLFFLSLVPGVKMIQHLYLQIDHSIYGFGVIRANSGTSTASGTKLKRLILKINFP